VLIFMPIELFVNGLYLSYFQIILLFLYQEKKSKIKIIVFLGYSLFVVISTMLGNDITLISLINPIMIGFALIVSIKNVNQANMIKNGLYISAAVNSFLLIYLVSQQNISSLYFLMTARTWALEVVPYFGNGLAILFSMMMVFAYKEKKLKFFLIFFVGGLLTTSRLPLLTMLMILLIYFAGNINNIKKASATGLFFIMLLLVPMFNSSFMPTNEMDGVVSRLTTANDRLHVYGVALSKYYENPIFGSGSEKLEYYFHAHNSFLQVAYSHGSLALIFWLMAIYMAFFQRLNFINNIAFYLIFALISLTQIGLHNLNALVVLTLYSSIFSNKVVNEIRK